MQFSICHKSDFKYLQFWGNNTQNHRSLCWSCMGKGTCFIRRYGNTYFKNKYNFRINSGMCKYFIYQESQSKWSRQYLEKQKIKINWRRRLVSYNADWHIKLWVRTYVSFYRLGRYLFVFTRNTCWFWPCLGSVMAMKHVYILSDYFNSEQLYSTKSDICKITFSMHVH